MKKTSLESIQAPSVFHLEQLLRQRLAENTSQSDKPLRYCIYLRKSTDDPEKQQRSIGDQRAECEEFAKRKGLLVVKVFPPESESAKISGKRPIFLEMLETIRKGKYDGIICWSPDRLARNLKEAGEVMDMLESKVLKDMQLVTHPYDGSASSKLALGIQFVMAKQYSDSLQENVNRGNKRSIEDGTGIGKDKHGYFRDEFSYYRPNGNNFELIKQAWLMRLAGRTYPEIGNFLQKNHYCKAIKTKAGKIVQKPSKVSPAMLTNMFRDPFYVGILEHGINIVNISEKYAFQPATTIEAFYELNHNDPTGIFKKGWQRIRNINLEAKPRANFLNGIAVCGYCNKPLYPGITTKKTTGIYYFRCGTEGCDRRNKSVRGRVILSFVLEFLEAHPLTSLAVWEAYKLRFAKRSNEVRSSLESQQKSLNQKIFTATGKAQLMKDYVLQAEDPDLIAGYEQDLKAKLAETKELEGTLNDTKELIEANNSAALTYPEFLELFSSLPDRIRQASELEEKDFYIREVFLNLSVTDNKITAYKLVPDLDGLIAGDDVSCGRGERI
jgi:DNA invertase Pin-like site-specific DNA recombinase